MDQDKKVCNVGIELITPLVSKKHANDLYEVLGNEVDYTFVLPYKFSVEDEMSLRLQNDKYSQRFIRFKDSFEVQPLAGSSFIWRMNKPYHVLFSPVKRWLRALELHDWSLTAVDMNQYNKIRKLFLGRFYLPEAKPEQAKFLAQWLFDNMPYLYLDLPKEVFPCSEFKRCNVATSSVRLSFDTLLAKYGILFS